MIGRQPLPAEWVDWNERWGAPYGRAEALQVSMRMRLTEPKPSYGPFAFQVTSGTRVFEYPWAYFHAGPGQGKRLLEMGGGMSGLQFVFAMEGYEVVNVDPLEEGNNGAPSTMSWWQMTPDLHDNINETFGTDVQLIRKRLQDADIEAGSFDRVVCLSVLEHLDQADARDTLEHIVRALAPGGILLVTIDLFFDLKPFGVLERNGYGTNLDVGRLVRDLGVELVEGNPREMLGFKEFDRAHVVSQVDNLFMSPSYPCASQAMVLRKPL